ncbi:MAG: hypothetical protein ACODAE_06190 [Gemmatimonadota bacterium]
MIRARASGRNGRDVCRPIGFAAGVVLLAACAAGSPDNADTVVLRGRVLDGTGRPPIENGMVVVEGERIRCVGRSAECEPPSGARTISAGTGTILPGLIDLHVHARPAYLGMFLAAGRRMDEFLRDDLFARLGITHFDWALDAAGNPHGMAGLRIRADD